MRWIGSSPRKFQLSLELRRQLAIREATLNQACQDRRDKMREKRKQRKNQDGGKEADHTWGEREDQPWICRANRGMRPWCPLSRQQRHWNHQCWRRISWRISWNLQRKGSQIRRKERSSCWRIRRGKQRRRHWKNKKAADENADSHEKAAAFASSPLMRHLLIHQPSVRSSSRAHSGLFLMRPANALYGRQGSVMSIGNEKYQLLLSEKEGATEGAAHMGALGSTAWDWWEPSCMGLAADLPQPVSQIRNPWKIPAPSVPDVTTFPES